MLSDFAERKETCFDYKKTEFFRVQKISFDIFSRYDIFLQ